MEKNSERRMKWDSLSSLNSANYHQNGYQASNYINEDSFGRSEQKPNIYSKREQIDQGRQSSSISNALASGEDMNLELFKQQLKLILPQTSPYPVNLEDGLMTGGASTQISTCVKEKGSTKSRQVSIHTNAFLNTDFDDDQSQRQDIFSTAHTFKKQGKLSFLTQTNTTFLSAENQIDEGMELKFQEGAKSLFDQVEMIKRKVQKGLLKQNDGKVKLRPTLKKKIRMAIEDPALIPMNVYYLIVSYDTWLFKQLMASSRGLRKHLLYYLLETVNSTVVQSFKEQYQGFFEFQKMSLVLSPISFCNENGVRLDTVLKFNLKKCQKLEGKTVGFGCSFQYEKMGKEEEYHTNYQMDVFPKASNRWLWLHKDECQFHGYSDQRSYTIPTVPVCCNDSVEIALTLLSLSGSLDLSSVRFLPLQSQKQPKQDDVRDYNRMKFMGPQRDLYQKYFADLNRVCEVEDTVVEWFLEEYARAFSLRQHIQRKVDLSQFSSQFDIVKVEIGGIDFSVWKIQLKAKRNCLEAVKYYEELRVEVAVAKERKQEITNEVKRSGFLIDRGSRIELREGDHLIVYVSMGGFEK